MHGQGFKIDPADPEYAPLLRAAGRIAELLRIADARKDDLLQYTADLSLGAVYAFVFAKLAGYEHRMGPAEPDKPAIRARNVASGWIQAEGKWIAGFHFNSAILRVAAVYHRSLKIALDDPDTKAFAMTLRPLAKARYPKWSDDNAAAIHREVNTIKHEAGGLRRRTTTPEEALKAIEEVIALLETWAATPQAGNTTKAEAPPPS